MLSEWPLLLLLACAGLGVAGQNISAGIAAVIFVIIELKRKNFELFKLSRQYVVPLASGGVLLLATALATKTNPGLQSPTLDFIGGFLFWLLAPLFLTSSFLLSKKINPKIVERICLVVVVMIAFVSLSQYFMGWKFRAGEFVGAEFRGRGFYSHPLSLAYAALIWLPFTLTSIAKHPRQKLYWVSFFAVFSVVITSASRTVQLASAGLIIWNILSATAGAKRRWLLCAFTALSLLVAVTNNPVANKFKDTFNRTYDRQGEFLDDRVAFWLVHWEMFKERPILGHGDNTNTEYRTPYYEKIGLQSFNKKYEAHNLFLQIMVNSGAIGFVAFMVWLVWNMRLAFRFRNLAIGNAALQVLAAISIAGLSQNAFQDSAVRFNLSLAIAALWIASQGGKAKSEISAPGK